MGSLWPGSTVAQVSTGQPDGNKSAPATVKVYFATNRKRTGNAKGRNSFRGERGQLSYGTLAISIPRPPLFAGPGSQGRSSMATRGGQQRHVRVETANHLVTDSFFAELGKAVSIRAKKDVLLFVHGAGVTFEDAGKQAAQLSYDIGFQGPVVLYSWPSSGTIARYTYDQQSAFSSIASLQRVLSNIVSRSAAENLFLIGNDLGARTLALATIAVANDIPTVPTKFRKIILSAPDIDRDTFEASIGPKLTKSAKSVTLYASASDRALSASRRVHGSVPRAGEITPRGPVHVDGIETIDATSTGTLSDAFSAGYAEAPARALLNDLRSSVEGQRPEGRRWLDRATGPDGSFWKFRSKQTADIRPPSSTDSTSQLGLVCAARCPGPNCPADCSAIKKGEPDRKFKPRGFGRKKAAPKVVNVCKATNVCTAVPIFFGTERTQRKDARRVTFTADRAERLQLGRALVTVPRASDRKRGEIPRPTWFERVILRVPPEGSPAKHFTIIKDGFRLFSNEDDFLAEVQEHMKQAGDFKDHAFIFVHGFNVEFDEALYRTAQIAYDLGYDEPSRHVPFGTAFLYSWPSSGVPSGYPYDQESARFTIPYLKEFVRLVAMRSGAKEVHLIAHSMGNVPLLNALVEFGKTPRTSGAKINQVILAAPDMDVKEFDRLARQVTPIAKSVTLYASSKDVAMLAARKVHRDKPRAGDVTDKGPVIINNVYSIDISALSTEIFSIKHSDYADKRELLSDMRRLFDKQEQPPDRRNVNFLRQFHDKKLYWKYAQ